MRFCFCFILFLFLEVIVMAYVAPTTRSVGDAVTAADYNIMANDVISFRNGTGVVKPMCRIQKASNTSPYTVGASIDFGATVYDTDTMVTTAFQITIKTAGVYEIICGVNLFGSSAFASLPNLRPILNGTAPGPNNSMSHVTGNYYTGVWIYSKAFSVNDTIGFSSDYSSGGTVGIRGSTTDGQNTFLQATQLGATS
jgi:hypothetical protein